MMSLPNSPGSEQIAANTTSIDFDSLSESAVSAYSSTKADISLQRSGCDVGWSDYSYLQDTPSTHQAANQKDIRAILSQLQTDLTETLHRGLPPEFQSNVENAIRTCVGNALSKWAPEPNINPLSASEPPLPTEAESPGSDTSFFDPDLFLSGDFLSPKFLKPLPSTQPAKDCTIIGTTSPKPPDGHLQTSSCSRRIGRKPVKIGWEKYKGTLYQLYVKEDLAMKEVIKVMNEIHGFKASVKQYRYQLGEKWGWKKYNGSSTKHGLGPEPAEIVGEFSIAPDFLSLYHPEAHSPGFDLSHDAGSGIVGVDDIEDQDECDMNINF
ncbi:hypothetical protein F5Y10DRAFT_255380 [Nemania abortiva]|nr:hypothetical protein F5Y10DRAFT_255380 [Nemania abortiva]